MSEQDFARTFPQTGRLDLAAEALARAATRIMERCDQLALVTSTPGSITRVYLSPEHARVNALAADWMRQVGMTTWQDAAGNQLGRLPARDPEAPALMLGSHLDSVKDAGRYDGIIGVLMAIETVALLAERDGGRMVSPFPFAIEVAAFNDEEGTRFGRAMMGSSAVAGIFEESWLDATDEQGVSLRQAYLDFGLDPTEISRAAHPADGLVGYLEAHIEQGPYLDRRGEPLAVVSSIASGQRFEITIDGQAQHAGGTPYDARHDALLGAAEAALAVERICSTGHHLIGTVGQIQLAPGAANVVPGQATFSLDLRGEFDGSRGTTRGNYCSGSSTPSAAGVGCAGAPASSTQPQHWSARRASKT
ncbi:hydantoinase/carbamoylase family amidase [Brevibacterium sp. 91QC2O2]|uniref:hydantoinase/carbamoylase family amidase n=1 Tax=Brevibacterium sp. 91QC2O2 TaxID=2968458 RepID=UPI00211CCDA7|nr:hydantoinase/carbamoylase family amidase [Brevibacterium sp. 91QC2O2]MCQ9367168.1 hydantoinase/carbamoylase family amidase [Brevibacterium sp. 91QC2O2]